VSRPADFQTLQPASPKKRQRNRICARKIWCARFDEIRRDEQLDPSATEVLRENYV
jgi:hypothetical protein